MFLVLGKCVVGWEGRQPGSERSPTGTMSQQQLMLQAIRHFKVDEFEVSILISKVKNNGMQLRNSGTSVSWYVVVSLPVFLWCFCATGGELFLISGNQMGVDILLDQQRLCACSPHSGRCS